MSSRWIVVVLSAAVAASLTVRLDAGQRGRGHDKSGPARERVARQARSAGAGLGSGVAKGGLGSGVATGVDGRRVGQQRKSRLGQKRRRGNRKRTGQILFPAPRRSIQRVPSRRGLGDGIPNGGLGRGISTGLGHPGTLREFPHAVHCGRLHAGSRKRAGLALFHYGVASFAPTVEPGDRAVYLEARWVNTGTGKIRFLGGWVSLPEEIDSVEPVWIPPSWYDADNGSRIRVSGHWDFVESP